MSQPSNTHPASDDAAHARSAGVLLVATAGVAAVLLQTHGMCSGSGWNPGFSGGFGLFEWPHWSMVLILVGTGLILTRGSTTPIAAAVALVVAAQLAGAGIVAQHHWRGAAGPGCGYWSNQQMIKGIAIVAAVIATVAALACLRVVWATGRARQAPERPVIGRVRIACLTVGVLVAVALPFLVAIGDRYAQDLTSLGAFALLWSLPWGGALALTAWLPRTAAVATALTVAVSAASAYPDYQLVQVDHHWVATLVGLASGLAVAALRSAPETTSEDGVADASRGEWTPR